MSIASCASRLGIAALAALLAGAAHAAEPYRIHVILTQTGAGAFLGQGQKQSLGIAEQVINGSGGIDGRPVQFVYEDDQTNPQTAVQLATEIIAAKPTVMLGSSLVASCRAIAPLVQHGPVDYCCSPGFHPEKGAYAFSSSVSTYDDITVQMRYFRIKGCRRPAVIVSTDATGQDAEAAIKETLALPENKDVSLAQLAHFNPGDVSVAAQIAAIKAANPQCLIAWATGTPIATIFRAILDDGLDVPTATTGGNMTYRQMEQYASILPRQFFMTSTEWVVRDPALLRPQEIAPHDTFYKSFAAAGKKPDVASELAWDPAMIVVAALRKLGANASAAQLNDYLMGLEDFGGINGIYDFPAVPQRGVGGRDSVVTTWSPSAQTWVVLSKPGGEPLK